MERRDQYILLQDISIEAEVQPHTLSPTLLVGGGQGAKSRVIRLSRSIPRGDLGDKDTHTSFRRAPQRQAYLFTGDRVFHGGTIEIEGACFILRIGHYPYNTVPTLILYNRKTSSQKTFSKLAFCRETFQQTAIFVMVC